jgi:flagellin-like protein
MNIKELFTDDSAVSPVIGVILMVAITVILAAVISFAFDYDTADDGNVTITHETGDSIEESQVNVSGFDAGPKEWSGSGTISAGASEKFDNEADWDGETVRVVWKSENGENSATLSTSTAPDES